MLAHVPSFGQNPRGSPDFLAYPVPKACQRRGLGTWVQRCLGVARSASSPKATLALGCSLTPGSGSRLAGSPAWHMLPQCPCYGHWVSYCCVALVFGSGFRGNPANPGWGLGCVCLGTGFGFAPPTLAGVCGVCVWAWVLPSPRQSWLGCWGVHTCMFVRALRQYLAIPGRGLWCVCSGTGFGFTPPILARVFAVGVCVWVWAVSSPRQSWLGCWSVCVCVRAPLAPRQSWLGCAVWVCVLGFGFRLRPAIPGWGVGVCVFVCVFRLYRANPGWGSWCVCLGSGLGFHPADSWLACWGVCVCVRALPIPPHSWLGCAVWACVLGFWFWLHPAKPGW